MAITLSNTIQNVRFRFANGPAGQFFRWWGEELRNAMPSQLRARMQYARRKLLIQFSDGELVFSIDSDKTVQSLDTVSVDQDPQLQKQQVQNLIHRHELVEVNRDLLLPESVVLHTHVVMPLAAEANLSQALAYEMDRHTPFSVEEIFYCWHNPSRDREAGQIRFDLYVTPREAVEAQIDQLKKLGLAPSGVDVATPDGPLGVNLLPDALRYHIVNRQVRVNWAISAVAFVLMMLVMAQSLWLREHQLETINVAIDDVRARALAVQQIRKQIDDASEAASFLQVRKIENGYKIEMLAELTRILPVDTYLDRLSMRAGTTQIQGKSGNAQGLIELINDSPYFDNASFRGPTRLDNRSGKEIFDLSTDNVTKIENTINADNMTKEAG